MKALYSAIGCEQDTQRKVAEQVKALVAELKGDARLARVVKITGNRFGANPADPPPAHAVLSAWSADAGALREIADAVATLEPAQERWDLWVEAVRVQGSLDGFVPPVSGSPMADDEPAVIHIKGDLTPTGTAPFIQAGVGVVAQALEHPEYTGGLFLA